MRFLRRVGDVVLLWLPVVAAIVVCYLVSARLPGVRPRADATMPVPSLGHGEWRGPSADELIERLERQAHRSAARARSAE